jgi:hypothetical protein
MSQDRAMMTSRPRRARLPVLLRAAAVLAAVTWTTLSVAAPSRQDVAKADKLFRDAKTLMGQGKLAEACPKLEESQSLDPAPGTKYQLAVCYEGTGRLATALAYYLEIADLAKAAGFKDKEKVARDRATALEPKVPRIVIEVAAADRPSGLAITRDGAAVEEGQYNRPILVDPGECTIEASAPGKKPFRSTVTVKGEGTRVTVPIRLQDVEDFGKRDVLPPPPPPSTGVGGQRIAGIVVGVAGLGGIAVGSVFGLQAKSTYDKAIKDTTLCPSKTACYPEGKKLVDAAQADATLSTIAFAAGGVVVAGGLVLILTGRPSPQPPASGNKPSSASATVVPVLAPGFGGLTAVGRF